MNYEVKAVSAQGYGVYGVPSLITTGIVGRLTMVNIESNNDTF